MIKTFVKHIYHHIGVYTMAALWTIFLSLASVSYISAAKANDQNKNWQQIEDESNAYAKEHHIELRFIHLNNEEAHRIVSHYTSDPNAIDYDSGVIMEIKGGPAYLVILIKNGIVVFEAPVPSTSIGDT